MNKTMIDTHRVNQGEEEADASQGHYTDRSKASTRDSRGNAFPLQLHYVLGELAKDGDSHVFSWLPHGRAIKVHDRFRFVNEVLPNWFRQSKIESFQRQLNMYGFKRITSGRDKNAYYHELFLRGYPELTEKMVRHKIKGSGPRKAACPEIEPDLWILPPLPDRREVVSATSRSPQDRECIQSQGQESSLVSASHVSPFSWRRAHLAEHAAPVQVMHALPLPVYATQAFVPSCTTRALAIASLPAPTPIDFSCGSVATLVPPVFLSYAMVDHPRQSVKVERVAPPASALLSQARPFHAGTIIGQRLPNSSTDKLHQLYSPH